MPSKHHQTEIRGTWVQTERAGHEAWASLIHSSPRAAQLMHILVANMDEKGALVASHKILAQLCGVSVMTVRRSLTVLTDKNFIQTIRIGSERGGVLAYVVNSRIAWADKRENIRYAKFSANVLVSSTEQTEELDGPPLKQIPAMSDGELQLPAGPGEPPPKQEIPDELLPDLPSINREFPF